MHRMHHPQIVYNAWLVGKVHNALCILSTRFTMNNIDFLCLANALPPLLPFSWIPTPNKACTFFEISAYIGCIARIECTACRMRSMHRLCAMCNAHSLLVFAHCSLQNLFPRTDCTFYAMSTVCTLSAFYTLYTVHPIYTFHTLFT